MQNEEEYWCERSDSVTSDLYFVVSIVFLAIKMGENNHGALKERLDCYHGENSCVDCHEFFIRQDVIDVEQLIPDTPHREATDDSDGPNSGKKEHIF